MSGSSSASIAAVAASWWSSSRFASASQKPVSAMTMASNLALEAARQAGLVVPGKAAVRGAAADKAAPLQERRRVRPGSRRNHLAEVGIQRAFQDIGRALLRHDEKAAELLGQVLVEARVHSHLAGLLRGRGCHTSVCHSRHGINSDPEAAVEPEAVPATLEGIS